MATSGASLGSIYTRLNSVPEYHPFSADTFSDWSMEAGDMVRVTRDGNTYDSPVHSSSLKWKGQSQISVSSDGNEERDPISKVERRKYARGGGGFRNDEFLWKELWDAYNGLYSFIEFTTSRLYVTFQGMYDGLSSTLELTRSRLYVEFKGMYDGLSSHFELTRSRMYVDFRGMYDGLSSAFEITRSRMYAEFQGQYDGLVSHFEVTRSRMYVDFRGMYDGLSSAFEITRSRMYAEFQGQYDGLVSHFELTRSRMYVDFKGAYDGLSSVFEITRSQWTSQFNSAYQGLSSRIQQTAERISLVVEGTGQNAHIKPAVIQASIDAASQTSKILLSADKVVIDGDLITSKVTADYISTKIQTLATLTAQNITANTITAGVNFVLPNGLNLSANGVWSISLSREGNTYKLTEMKLNGDERTVGTFSRATTLAGTWSGGTFTVSASPQGNEISAGLFSVAAGDITWSGNTATFPVYANLNGGETKYNTGKTLSVNASARYNAGYDANHSMYITGENDTPLSTDTIKPGETKNYYPTFAKIGGGLQYGTRVQVSAPSISTQTKTVNPSTSAQTVKPDSGYYLSQVTVTAAVRQAKTITPGSSSEVVTPDAGYYGLSKVTINMTGWTKGTFVNEAIALQGSPTQPLTIQGTPVEAIIKGSSTIRLGSSKTIYKKGSQFTVQGSSVSVDTQGAVRYFLAHSKSEEPTGTYYTLHTTKPDSGTILTMYTPGSKRTYYNAGSTKKYEAVSDGNARPVVEEGGTVYTKGTATTLYNPGAYVGVLYNPGAISYSYWRKTS